MTQDTPSTRRSHSPGAPDPDPQDTRLEATVRQRLRSLRVARGWSLEDMARRSGIGASTISRIETGHRRIALDQVVSLARVLETTIDDLFAEVEGEDVIIRPIRDDVRGAVHWQLTRPDDPSGRFVSKMRIPASKKAPELQVHPGRDWFYVLDGAARLVLGQREHLVRTGQAVEFDTMTPHWIAGYGGPVEVLMIFDRHGRQAHLRTS